MVLHFGNMMWVIQIFFSNLAIDAKNKNFLKHYSNRHE